MARRLGNALQITCDTAPLLNALTQFGESLQADLNVVAKITADNIAREAERRVQRRTGETAKGITVDAAYNGKGYVVFVKQQRMPNLPIWLEFGTKKGKGKHANQPFPFLLNSAKLEEWPNQRRMLEAVQAAIDLQGLGE